ncbi:nucleolar protein 12-like [Daphnia carinata]|uniref:nucleolar protein 12-like n=1 Tax=Daphnia carinata TaxID=120202 RepID=UPI00257BA8AE|nr:nucleolar protein 12-like [Daphnia carinata]
MACKNQKNNVVNSKHVKQKGGNYKPKNRLTKVNLIFDEKARKEYLTGFRKRKAERRKKFNENLKKEIKSERKRLQTELREDIKKSASNRRIPEIEHLIEDVAHVYELPEHTIKIEPILDSQIRNENIFLGKNEASLEASDPEIRQTLLDKKKKTKDLNRQMNKKLLKTKAFKRQTQMVRDKSRKRGKHLKNKK